MTSKVTIGNLVTSSPVSIKIESSISKLADKATVIIPRNYSILQNNQKQSLAGKNILDFIKVGDAVSIELGYDNKLHSEFKGYISNINADVPLVIECEDEMWQLRQQSFTKSYQSVTLEQLLKDIAGNYTIKPVDINLGKYVINNATAYEVLQSLRNDYLLYAYFRESVLYVGFPTFIIPQKEAVIHLHRNVKPTNDLKFVRKSDFKLQIKAISNNTNGSKEIVTVGDSGGAIRTLNFFNKSKSELQKIAQENLESLSFDGYQGTVTLFGAPNVKVGDKISIIDPDISGSEKEGSYLIEEVVTTYSSSGYRQKVKLGMKL